MSTAPSNPKGPATRLLQATMLGLVFGLLWLATTVAPDTHGALGTIAALGFLLLAGTLMSEILEPIGVPHLTGYLAAGILAGPHALVLLDHHTVDNLTSVNALALALIALAGGAELKLGTLRQVLGSLAWATLSQCSLVFAGMTLIFFLARPLIPFTHALTLTQHAGIAMLWATLAVSRSPSATLAVLSQTRARGPLASWTLAFVMTSDVVVVVMLAAVMTFARTLIEPGASVSLKAFHELGYEIVGSVAIGTTLGLVLAAYMRFVGSQMVVVYIALGFGMTEVLRYLHFDPLLTFMVAGFLVQNLSQQGARFLHSLEEAGGVVYVVFFATAGAHLDVPLLRKLWPVAVLLCVTRGGLTLAAARLSSLVARDEPAVRTWGFGGLVSQAGLTLGLSAAIERSFPRFGPGFRALSLASIALNEIIGPILFKFALDRTGETSRTQEAVRPTLESLRPPATPDALRTPAQAIGSARPGRSITGPDVPPDVPSDRV